MTKEQLKVNIHNVYVSQANFARSLMDRFPWRFTTLKNAEGWVSKKVNGVRGLTQTDKMFFELWFNIQDKKK